MDKLVFIKEVSRQEKGERHWLQAVDQDAVRWNIFLDGASLEADKAYLFSYVVNEKGFSNVTKITPVTNLFQQQALRQVTNANDIMRTYSVAYSYSKDLVIAGQIPLEQLTAWADKIYEDFLSKGKAATE
jgi:hypothetical protein